MWPERSSPERSALIPGKNTRSPETASFPNLAACASLDVTLKGLRRRASTGEQVTTFVELLNTWWALL
jgi:hypothetical protein